MRTGRRPETRITDPALHPKPYVCLRVGAEYLGVDERTLRARIESGALPARRNGKRYLIAVAALVRYNNECAHSST